MPEELSESLKKYVPGPVLLVLTLLWGIGGDQIKERAQAVLKEPDAHIVVKDETDPHTVGIAISRHSRNGLEEVRVVISLRARPKDFSGTLKNVEGAKTPLLCVEREDKEIRVVCSNAGLAGSPITMRQQESLEVSVQEGMAHAVLDVAVLAKGHEEIDWSDLNQKYRLPEMTWRAGLVILGICAIYSLYYFLLHLFSRRAKKQLEEDKEFLHKCWQRDATALAEFLTKLQPVIDDGAARYLKAFAAVIRDNARLVVIPQMILERADALPQFRRSLKGQVQRFVIKFCLDMLKHEYKALKGLAKQESARIR